MSSTYERYQIKEIIGEGGMGIVYRAVDREMQSDVALKTIKELLDPRQIDLFRRECAVLRKLSHPNVVNVYDYGIRDEKGQEKPFFVMPLLAGVTLDKLIRSHAARLTPDRVVDIITQTARGLQAAHDQDLVHRDVKPSNIFVLSDDSVKLIDFGVVHLTDQHSRTGFKGTLPYMSPEQLELNPPTAVSDVFSLAAVCYEALTRRRPFTGNTENEIREAILHSTPPTVSELNPAVSLALSQVVHAAMAKQPWHRTSTARQFAEELQRALHGQPIERFDPSRIEPRIARAQKALEASQYDFAAEILDEVEAEGHIHPTIRSLRRQIDQAIRAKAVKQALESAQHRFAENEYQLALQKLDEVLRLDPSNAEALALKSEIDIKHRNYQIENWFRLAQDHIRNYAYNHARQALQNVLRLKPTNTMAIQMISDVDRRENEYLREHQEKEELYKSALEAWHRGEVSAALSKLERVLELDRRAPDSASSESAVSYQNLYNQVRNERDRIKNAYEEARKLLGENDFGGASSLCEQVLGQYPEQTLFHALKFDIGEGQRQHVSAYIVKIDREVEAEPDLDRKVAILTEALAHYSEEAHFRDKLDRVTRRRDLVASITERVRNLEERGQYAEALGQLETLRAIYPQYPGLDLEADRITRRRDQQSKADAKSRWVNQIDRAISTGDFSHALNLVKSALTDLPNDAELLAQERLARDGQDRCQEAIKVFESAQASCAQGDLKGGLDSLWQAHRLDEHNGLIQAVLVETLLKRASSELDKDLKLSEKLVSQAIELDPGSASAGNLQRMVLDRQRDRAVDLILSGSREAQAAGDNRAALSVIQKGLAPYPDEQRLLARQEALLKLVAPAGRPEEKEKDLLEMRQLHERLREADDAAASNSILEQSRVIAGKYSGDREVESVFRSLEDEWSAKTVPSKARVKVAKAKIEPPPVEAPVEPPLPPEEIRESALRVHLRSLSEKMGVGVSRLKDVVQTSGQALVAMPRKRLAILGAVPIGVIVVLLVVWIGRVKPPPPPPPPLEVALEVSASVPGAHLLVNGSDDRGAGPLTLKLGEGSYTFDAKLAGYVSKPEERRIERGATVAPVRVQLDELPAAFSVSTEFPRGSLDTEQLMLDGTGFEKTGLANGPHVLQLSSPIAGTITVEFEMAAGQLPMVRKVDSHQTLVVAVATLDDHGQLYSSLASLKVGVNGPADREAGDQALPVSLLPGRNLVEFDDSKNPVTGGVQADANPRLTIFVGAQPNVGNLEVTETGKVDGSVSVEPVDKRAPPRIQRLVNGKASFARLSPKMYVVEASAPGYEKARTTVSVIKGDVVPASLTLVAVKQVVTTFEIRGGTPDADVFIDNNPTGVKLTPNGDFSYSISLAKHRIQLRKRDFEDSQPIELDFTAGGSKSLAGPDVTLRPFGWIEFNVLPTTSRITYSLNGGTTGPVPARNGDAPRVKAGRYTITVKADGQQDFVDSSFDVEAGRGKAFNKTFSMPPPPPGPGPNTVRTFDKDIIDRETPQTPFRLSRAQEAGTYSFRIKLRRPAVVGKKRAKWVVNYVDSKNYIEYELDEKTLKYTVRQNGSDQSKSVSHSVSGSEGDFYNVAVGVVANAITVSVGDQPIPIDRPGSSGNFLAGKFGFPQGENWDQFQLTTSGK
ncbi:MAG TPA: protein kinase [Terriglobia bacterium]|nr:protein kinase [Terriglobia bacterium]